MRSIKQVSVGANMMPVTFNASQLDPDQEVDLPKLMAIISDCHKMVRDDRYSEQERDSYLDKAHKLAKQRDRLLGEYFTKGIAELKKANAAIKKVKDATNQAIKDFKKTADTLEQIGALINALDDVIKLLPIP